MKSFDVLSKFGLLVRTYSEAEHGKDFIALAEMFCEKNGYEKPKTEPKSKAKPKAEPKGEVKEEEEAK